MKVELTLHVSAEEMHAFVLKMVKDDIKEATGERVKASDLAKGYTYQKKMRKGRKKYETANAHVEVFNENQYTASFDSSKGTTRFSYFYTPLGDMQVRLVYEEETKPKGFFNSLSYRYGQVLHGDEFNRNMKEYLQNIETYIEEKRKQKERA